MPETVDVLEPRNDNRSRTMLDDVLPDHHSGHHRTDIQGDSEDQPIAVPPRERIEILTPSGDSAPNQSDSPRLSERHLHRLVTLLDGTHRRGEIAPAALAHLGLYRGRAPGGGAEREAMSGEFGVDRKLRDIAPDSAATRGARADD
ncbi:hypothetical protein GV791_27025 [Nocardia cyriacigeorgica]|uniref:Uncharacterized protein n=1 Tax=Nocardia cyriacigeorgica TaxID=135487 RepID=A0A6P1CWL0_9NOCA|nr:hypothetical protein [Nocardia cyriacigeorgica]NEW36187.1 hypothetical protein [Nocardia cyriacigeorgica]